MTQADSRFPTQPAPVGKARNDVYTVLLIIATTFVFAATIVLGYVCYDYYGTFLPSTSS
ncbi:MAG: hypothetical protein JXQ73_26320 [Phycisphaerae bacterium]|nr:hypothetical protein [Phycisphaerae bacterium]